MAEKVHRVEWRGVSLVISEMISAMVTPFVARPVRRGWIHARLGVTSFTVGEFGSRLLGSSGTGSSSVNFDRVLTNIQSCEGKRASPIRQTLP